ncbi:DUF547 domain-containing protein [Parerythrobacter aestuarii]|uniref:DUF547 domain-containing protein n=1 Tax=Parerythrobacter aestuarii TaxID=3020909 RepID=UPI0024DE5C1D|nr:DUF547 domain-containing protein [Parerythrobacter aestuarii]
MLFAPAPAKQDISIDYGYWDAALKEIVFKMGRSERKGAPSVSAGIATRFVYGHESRLRLEGNRVLFSFLEDEQLEALTAYRQDLEAVAAQVDLTSLPRNEQLAFWLNLHNVAVIEQISRNYPVKRPAMLRLGEERVPLDEAKIVSIAGVMLSPRDIRIKIVYPNWQDPKVIYGFFRGEIGGPSIMREAFTGENVSDLLDEAADEFVNSLRGTEKRGKIMHVSRLYEEAIPFYFPDRQASLRAHLIAYSDEDVRGLIERTHTIEPSLWEEDISDLAGAEFDPQYYPNPVPTNGLAPNIARLVGERNAKLERMIRRGKLIGKVTVIDMEKERKKEVE